MRLIKSNVARIRAIAILKRAFKTMKSLTWMVEENRNPEKALAQLLSLCVMECEERRGAFLSTDGKGVLLFYQLQQKKISVVCLLKKLYVMFAVIGLKRSIQIIRTREFIGRNRPKEGWYGWFLATQPDANGVHAAFEIKREMYRLADESRLPIFVETTQLRNALLYEKIGFTTYACLKHPYQHHDIWMMRRDPAPINA